MDTHFIKNLLTLCLSENLNQMLATAYRNYHVPGFNSIILSQSPTLTLRLYVCKPGETALRPDNDQILVHNHSFDFQTQVLLGYMENAVYEGVEASAGQAEPWYQYTYESAVLRDDHTMRLKLLNQTPLTRSRLERVVAGQSYGLRHDELHRIFVPSDRPVAMLFWQHRRIEQTPLIFSKVPQPEIFPTQDLYHRFDSAAELKDLVHLVIDHLP
ncbi:MAG: hypothetical protein O2890_04300 [Cyanobacteria bacterium]|nr:hypothetical protein [Cyanobacteriota bacterium]